MKLFIFLSKKWILAPKFYHIEDIFMGHLGGPEG